MEYIYPVSPEIIIQHFKQVSVHTKTYEQVFVFKSFYKLIIYGSIKRPSYVKLAYPVPMADGLQTISISTLSVYPISGKKPDPRFLAIPPQTFFPIAVIFLPKCLRHPIHPRNLRFPGNCSLRQRTSFPHPCCLPVVGRADRCLPWFGFASIIQIFFYFFLPSPLDVSSEPW
jgi:hypothetical protein